MHSQIYNAKLKLEISNFCCIIIVVVVVLFLLYSILSFMLMNNSNVVKHQSLREEVF